MLTHRDPTTEAATNRAVRVATFCSALMIAQQVAGKAARDALFLSNLPISALPLMLIATALLSIAVVLLTSRAMALLTPARIAPIFFGLSAVLLLAEWGLALHRPKPAAVLVYLHIAVFGSVLISCFWSVVNERFDPRTAKKRIGRIVGGAALGGLCGGLLAERIAASFAVPMMLPVLALLQLICAWMIAGLKPVGAKKEPTSIRMILSGRTEGPRTDSVFKILAEVPYLQNLAHLVLLGTLTATLLDFVFKAEATKAIESGENLMRFFALFYTLVSLITFAIQSGMSRRFLEKFGLTKSVASLPWVVAAGGLGAFLMPGLLSIGIVRGLEAVVRCSLFRSGYELLYTPISLDQKRATKAVVDVGFDRLGDALGGGVVRLIILLPATISGHILIALAVCLSVVTLIVARTLHSGYVKALERSLMSRAVELDIKESDNVATRTTMMMQSLSGFDLSVGMEGFSAPPLPLPGETNKTKQRPAGEAASVSGEPAATQAPLKLDPYVELIAELRSGDPERVRKALKKEALSLESAAQVIPLLAWDEVTHDVSKALARIAPQITGQLLDHLLDPGEEFAIRRRVPRILGTCATERAVEGLLKTLQDRRFEVRYQAGRALARIHDAAPELPIDKNVVLATVRKEVKVDKRVWESERLLDRPGETERSPFVDEVLRNRTNRSMEHVFVILSLVLPKDPLKISFRGLHTTDEDLRGTALEYLESVLPEEIRESLWPFLEERREARHEERPREEVLEDLIRSNQSIEMNLAELRKRIQEGSRKENTGL